MPSLAAMPEFTEIGLLKLLNEPEWRRRVHAALDAAGGNRTHAAAALGVSYRQFCRWADALGLERLPNQHAQKVASRDANVIAKRQQSRRRRGETRG